METGHRPYARSGGFLTVPTIDRMRIWFAVHSFRLSAQVVGRHLPLGRRRETDFSGRGPLDQLMARRTTPGQCCSPLRLEAGGSEVARACIALEDFDGKLLDISDLPQVESVGLRGRLDRPARNRERYGASQGRPEAETRTAINGRADRTSLPASRLLNASF